MEMRYLLNVIVVQVKENQSWQAYKIFNFLDMIVLKVEQAETLLSLKQGHVSEISLIEVQSIWVSISF